jgi:hypothetical protein
MGRKRKAETWQQRANRNGWQLHAQPIDRKHLVKRPEGIYFRVLQRVESFELRHYPAYPEYGYQEVWMVVACDQPYSLLSTPCVVSKDRAVIDAEWAAVMGVLQVA